MAVTPVLLDLLDRYPEITLTTMLVDRVVHLVDEGIDVAIRIAELPDSALSAVRVGSVRRVLCASPRYLDARGRPATPGDLRDHDTIDFATMAPGDAWAFEKDGQRHRFRSHGRLRVDHADAVIAAARAGHGIARVLSYMITPELQAGALELVLDDLGPPPVPIHVVHKELGQTSARVRAVVDHLAEGLRRRVGPDGFLVTP